MSFTRILSFSRSPMRIPSRRAVWLAVAGLLVFLATWAPASATNLLYVSLYYDTRIVSYDVDAGDGAAIAASRRIFATTRGNPTGQYVGTGPYGVTFDHQGNLYASIPYSHIINKFDPTGVYLGDITSPNFSLPNGMATDAAGNLYVANGSGNTISKFDPAGNYLATIGSSATLSGPYGLAFDAAGYLYASNGRRTTNFISAFDPAGNYSADHSLGADHLYTPIGLAFDAAGDLHVANYDGGYIATFDAAGKFQGAISTNNSRPYGLSIDNGGNLYVMHDLGRILKYDPSGALVTSWSVGDLGSLWGAFRYESSVPEIDPSSFGSALGLLVASLGLIERRVRSAGRIRRS